MSNAIRNIRHDDNGDLFVTFTSGVEVCYSSVPTKVVKEFRTAESKGGFFNRSIRNQYKVR